MNTRGLSELVVIDVETSGVNPFLHEVLAVALVPVSGERPPKTVYVRPPTTVWTTYARTLFEKYAIDWENTAVPPDEACEAIEEYLRTTFNGSLAIPVGHNIGFDMGFLRKLAFLGGREQLKYLSHRTIDTHALLYTLHLSGHLPDSALSSDGAFAHFGLSIRPTQRHTALGDAQATRVLFLRLLSIFEELSQTNPLRRQTFS